MWFDGNWMFFGGFFMMLFWVAILILIVWLIVRLVQREDSSSHKGKSRALDIAKERYAKGEITREEFEQFKKDL
jgi:putative membrane protein